MWLLLNTERQSVVFSHQKFIEGKTHGVHVRKYNNRKMEELFEFNPFNFLYHKTWIFAVDKFIVIQCNGAMMIVDNVKHCEYNVHVFNTVI